MQQSFELLWQTKTLLTRIDAAHWALENRARVDIDTNFTAVSDGADEDDAAAAAALSLESNTALQRMHFCSLDVVGVLPNIFL